MGKHFLDVNALPLGTLINSSHLVNAFTIKVTAILPSVASLVLLTLELTETWQYIILNRSFHDCLVLN